MNDFLYEVVFYGQIHQDAELDAVKARIGKMFKADEVTIARLFSGKRIVIKKNLSAEAADKYSIAFARAGAICELVLMPEGSASPAPAGDRAATQASASAAAAGGDAAGKRNFRKMATLAAIAIAVVAALIAAALYVTGILAG